MSTWLEIPGVEVMPLPDRANEVKLKRDVPPDARYETFEVRTYAGQRSRKQTSLEQLTERMRQAGECATVDWHSWRAA